MGVEPSAWKISLSDIDFGADEEQAALEVVRSKWLSTGAKTAEFERRFAERLGCRHAVAVSNCTAALHLALLAAGVGPGDEVVVPSLTFVATVNAVLYCGAVPVFGDIAGMDDLRLDPEDAARKLSRRTKAVVPMHYGGYPCNMDAFSAMASGGGPRVVDDAAHAPGSVWRGRPVGTLADASCFSFYANKNLVTGEGGMVTTDNDAIGAFARMNRSHGMTALSYDKHRGHAIGYDVVSVGFNYRMTEIQAALGIVQLGKLDRNNAVRRGLTRAYRERLAAVPGLTIPFAGGEDESACHLFVVVLPERVDRTLVQGRMKELGIQTSVHYPPVHRFSSYRGRFPAEVPVVDRVADRLMTLPLHPLMSVRDVDEVSEGLAASLG
jgi:dTDP-4-amino-4,6-dideoxygalactose transaminase